MVESPLTPSPASDPGGPENPYVPPMSLAAAADHAGSASKGPPGAGFWIVTVLVLPLILSQAVFWLGFLSGGLLIHNDPYALGRSLVGLLCCAIGGAVYGLATGYFVRRRWPLAPTALIVVLTLAQLFLFPALATGGCLGFAMFVGSVS